MPQITYTPKPNTTTKYFGSNGLMYTKCRKDATYYTELKCPVCELRKTAERLEKEVIKQAKIQKRKKRLRKEEAERKRKKKIAEHKKNVRFYVLWKKYESLIESIKDLMNMGFSTEILFDAFFDERNPPYDLSNKKPSYRIQLQPFGAIPEHINGRVAIGYYCVYAIVIGDIKNPQELEQFYLNYCGQIYTDADFNSKVIKPYQNKKNNGAINPDTYIEVLEKERSVYLTDDEKEYFRSKFLYSKYGKILKEHVIEYIRNGKEVNN